jgi:hypothetical protein
MARMLFEIGGIAMMHSDADRGPEAEDMLGTDDPNHFPVRAFRRLIALGGYYRSSARYGEVTDGESFFGIPWAAVERARLADVVTAVARVLDDAKRHRLTAKHFPVWCAMECGVIIETRAGRRDWRYAFPDKPRKVMDDRETARLFRITEQTATDYRNDVQTALDSEWRWLKTRER